METLTLTIDTIALIVAIYFSLKNERLEPGEAEIGPFRIVPPAAEPNAAVVPARRRTRRL